VLKLLLYLLLVLSRRADGQLRGCAMTLSLRTACSNATGLLETDRLCLRLLHRRLRYQV
jgi:hypothetical protein